MPKVLIIVAAWFIGFILTGNWLWKEDLGAFYRKPETLSDDFLNPLAVFVAARAAIWFFYWPYRLMAL